MPGGGADQRRPAAGVDAIVDVPGVLRTSTVIALAAPVAYRVLPLVRAACGRPPPGGD